MNEKDLLITEAISELSVAIRQLSHKTDMMEVFLRDNFRNFNAYSASVYGTLDVVSRHLEKIRQLSATNKDNAHKLEKELKFDSTVGMDENGNYRRGPVPQQQQRFDVSF